MNHLEEDLKPVKKPNFFILGAGKCGTTSLYHYLKFNPQIFMSEVKEPSFFCETFQIINNPISYFELFDEVQKEHVIGEASHVYMTDPKSPRVINHFFPEAKFLISLRNPAERAFSLYNDMRNHGWESARSFEEALIKEETRVSSEEFKLNNPQYFHNFLYFHSGLYGQQIQRYFSHFTKSQFLIIRLEDLESDFHNTIKAIFDFLKVDNSFIPESAIHNKTLNTRSHRIQQLLIWSLPESVIRQKLMNHTYSKKTLLDPQLKADLMKRYFEDQELLYSLTGIKFT